MICMAVSMATWHEPVPFLLTFWMSVPRRFTTSPASISSKLYPSLLTGPKLSIPNIIIIILLLLLLLLRYSLEVSRVPASDFPTITNIAPKYAASLTGI